MNADDHDFGPSASLEALRLRAELLKKLRLFFDRQGFLEVNTPVLSADTIVDLHLDPFRVTVFDDPCQPETGETWYLQTSPEFHMKRLVAAGAEAIYQVGPAFRGAETGPLHNIEFTIVEWYRVGDDMAAGIQRLSDLAELLLQRGPSETVTYAEAFAAATGLNPHQATDTQLTQAAARHRESADSDSRNDCLDILWTHAVEPNLARDHPVIICDYPATQSALARLRNDANGNLVAERFELYCHGVELANGYHELTDVEEFKSRIEAANQARKNQGKTPLSLIHI